MTTINLLPWREELREKKKREFLSTCLLITILAAIAAFATYMYFSQILSDQQAANQKIEAANKSLDTKLKDLDGLQQRRQEILDRMKLIQDLQGVRPVTVHVFDEIAKLTPKELYLEGMKREGDTFTLIGKAKDPEVISGYLTKLGNSPWFRNAFMKSFDSVESKQQKEGGVTPRPEDSYGRFVITVDLDNVATAATENAASVSVAASAPVSSNTPASSTKPATAEKVK